LFLNLQTWRTQLQPVIVVASVEDSETEAGEVGAVATGEAGAVETAAGDVAGERRRRNGSL
jgi:hypothetical protein